MPGRSREHLVEMVDRLLLLGGGEGEAREGEAGGWVRLAHLDGAAVLGRRLRGLPLGKIHIAQHGQQGRCLPLALHEPLQEGHRLVVAARARERVHLGHHRRLATRIRL